MTPPASYVIRASPEQLKLAGDEPTRGWPTDSVLYPDDNPTGVIRDTVSNSKNVLNLEASHGRATGTEMGPRTAALKAAKAVMVGPGEFRALDDHARLLRPLFSRELKGRTACSGEACRDWRLGVRLGPNAPGIYSQRVSDLDATTPGIRKAGFREVIEVLRRPGQAGHPPIVETEG